MSSDAEPDQTVLPGRPEPKISPAAELEILSPEDLVARWRGAVKARTLRDWRRQGKGPEWFRLGGGRSPVLYRLEAVRAWERVQEGRNP